MGTNTALNFEAFSRSASIYGESRHNYDKFHATLLTWRQPVVQGAAAAAIPTALPPWNEPQDVQYLGQTRIWAPTGHPGDPSG